MSDLNTLLAHHWRVQAEFLRAGEAAFAAFEAVLAEAQGVIRDAEDQRPEAVAMRDRVRAAMRAASGAEPGTELYDRKQALRASQHALRAAVLSDSRGATPPTSA